MKNVDRDFFEKSAVWDSKTILNFLNVAEGPQNSPFPLKIVANAHANRSSSWAGSCVEAGVDVSAGSSASRAAS